MSLPFPAFALFGEPHTGKPPRIQRVRAIVLHGWLDCVAVEEVDAGGYGTRVCHVLPSARVASLKTLAAKTAEFSAPNPDRRSQTVAGGLAPRGMTDSGAVNPQPENA